MESHPENTWRVLEISLLVIELILLIFTVIEIRRSRKTHHLLNENTKVTKQSVETIVSSIKLLERDKIYFYLSESARDARQFVHHLSIAQSTSEINDEEEKRRVNDFLTALDGASKNIKDIKILGPDLSSKIGGLWQRRQVGAEVRVSPIVTSYDFRVQIVDRKKVIIGVASPESRSQFGFLIESLKLAEILDGSFMELWFTAKPLDENIKDVISRHIGPYAEHSLLDETIRSLLNVPTQEMAIQIIDMLLESQDIQIINERVYKRHLLDELLQLDSLSVEAICKTVELKGVPITEYQAERIIEDLSMLDQDAEEN